MLKGIYHSMHAHIRIAPLDCRHCLDAVHRRHGQIHEHQKRCPLTDGANSIAAVGGLANPLDTRQEYRQHS